MDVSKHRNGITLVSLVVTIIIIVILAGISLNLVHSSLGTRITSVASKVEEASLQETIEMAWVSVEADYWAEKNYISMTKSEYFMQGLKNQLENTEDIKDVTVSGNIDDKVNIAFTYKNTPYQFEVLASGEVKLSNPFKGNVKIGDYVEYPIEYEDVWSGKQYTAMNGWRVIDDGVTEGTSGYVRIISTGIPIKWYDNSMNNEKAVDQLLNHFEDIVFVDDSEGKVERKGSEFKVETMAFKVSTISLSDLNQIYNVCYGTNRALDDTSFLEDELELFNLKSSGIFYYWLATKSENHKTGLYMVSDEGIAYDADIRMGIRPVIYLKDGGDVKFEDNVWKIVD